MRVRIHILVTALACLTADRLPAIVKNGVAPQAISLSTAPTTTSTARSTTPGSST